MTMCLLLHLIRKKIQMFRWHFFSVVDKMELNHGKYSICVFDWYSLVWCR